MNKYDENYLKNNLEILNKNYLKFLLCYNLYLENNNLKNKYLLGEEKVQKNLNIMDEYSSIFLFFDFGTLDLAIIELNKIFNSNGNDEIDIFKIKNYISQHRKTINEIKKDNFLSKCNDFKKTVFKDFSIQEIIDFEGGIPEIKDDFEKDIKIKIKNLKTELNFLLYSRHNRSHNFINGKVTNLKFIDINKIQRLFEELFNIIQKNVWGGIYNYTNYEEIIRKDFNSLFIDLSDFYKIRSLFFDNYLKNLGKTDKDICNEIKQILKIDFT